MQRMAYWLPVRHKRSLDVHVSASSYWYVHELVDAPAVGVFGVSSSTLPVFFLVTIHHRNGSCYYDYITEWEYHYKRRHQLALQLCS